MSTGRSNDAPDDDKLPKILTKPRDDAENDKSGCLGHFRRLSLLSREAAGRFGAFLDRWSANWFRMVLTGLALGGIIGLMYKCSIS